MSKNNASKNKFYKLLKGEKFSDVKPPQFKKDIVEGWMSYGADNLFPQQSTLLYRKSSKHGAIVRGKMKYIYGGGWKPAKTVQGDKFICNIQKKVTRKVILDIEQNGGFYLEVIPKLGGSYKFYNITFSRMRSDEKNEWFFYRKNWEKKNYYENELKKYPAFYPGIKTKSIIYFKEADIDNEPYSLPGWFAASNYIEADVEVSKHTLGNAKKGFKPSKFINFYNGDPEASVKQEMEEQFGVKYTGSEAQTTIIAFNDSSATKPTIEDLGASDLTKEDFTAVDNLISSNIYAGHEVTNPVLFGIQIPGKLGGAQELRESYEIFNNTYAKFKREQVEDFFNSLAKNIGILGEEFELNEAPPVGVVVTEDMIKAVLSNDEIRELIGKEPSGVIETDLLKRVKSLPILLQTKVIDQLSKNQLLELVGLPPVEGGEGAAGMDGEQPLGEESMVNEHIKGLTGRNTQQLNRIISQVSKGKMAWQVGFMLLKTGLALSDEQIEACIGKNPFPTQPAVIQPINKFSAQYDPIFLENFTANLFDEYGVERDEFETHDSREANIEQEQEFAEQFGLLDGIKKLLLPKLEVKYSYEKKPGVAGAEVLPTTRPFCKKLCELNKFYSRQDIQRISEIVGYSVFDRRGGFWRKHDGSTSESCRHIWKMHIVTKK